MNHIYAYPPVVKETIMSCYFRHMKEVLDEVGISVTNENKKDLDRIIHELVAVEYKNCPPAWKEVKARIKTDEKARSRFVAKLKKATKGIG